MDSSNKDGKVYFQINKQNPKPNPCTFHIETVQDIFDATNIDNVDKFLSEFKMVLCSGYLLRATAAAENLPDEIKLPSFEWTDD